MQRSDRRRRIAPPRSLKTDNRVTPTPGTSARSRIRRPVHFTTLSKIDNRATPDAPNPRPQPPIRRQEGPCISISYEAESPGKVPPTQSRGLLREPEANEMHLLRG